MSYNKNRGNNARYLVVLASQMGGFAFLSLSLIVKWVTLVLDCCHIKQALEYIYIFFPFFAKWLIDLMKIKAGVYNSLFYFYNCAGDECDVKYCLMWFQLESGQGDLGTLANVVTSLANLSDSLKENLNNGDTSDSQHEEQSASEITRSVSSALRCGECVCVRNHDEFFCFLCQVWHQVSH